MKSIALGKEMFGLPEKEEQVATHFIRQDEIDIDKFSVMEGKS